MKRCIELYKSGWSAQRIHKMTGVPPRTIYDWLKAAKIRRRGRFDYDLSRRDHKFVDQVIDMYKSGMSCNEIADDLGYATHTAIRSLIVRSGFPLRSRGESLKLAYERGRREVKQPSRPKQPT